MFRYPFRKSYDYQVQMPPSESKPDETKYKFDYTIQAPVEEKPVETQQRTMYTKVDRMTEDKQGKNSSNFFQSFDSNNFALFFA